MKTLTGIFPPIPTPFLDGELAPDKLALNIGKWNKTELRGYVVFGSNGESVFLTREEKLRMVAEVKRYASDDKIIIAGTGSESIKETVSLTNEAAGLGADYALVVTPSYYKSAMNHEALVTYYTMVADAVTIPVILYNVPKFTGVDIQAETVAKLAGHPNIAGVKNSTENIRQLIEFVARTSPDFAVIAGTASMLYGGFLTGASGGIVALANIAPDQCVRIQQLVASSKLDDALVLQQQLIPVNTAVTSRYGVAGLKAAMDLLGYFGGDPRAPLLPVVEKEREILKNVLIGAGLL
jgi:4-hydroxy-2-oxoglutarate aldolase